MGAVTAMKNAHSNAVIYGAVISFIDYASYEMDRHKRQLGEDKQES